MGQYTKIDDASSHFQIINWTGNTTTPRDITHTGNSELKPDIHWAKTIDSAGTDHRLYDSNRGLGTERSLQPNSNAAEATGTTYGIISHFLTNGFTTAAGGTNDDNYNENGKKHIAFSWKVNGGTTSTITTSGSPTTTVQVNAAAGISIVTWDGADTSNKTIYHGLGQTPEFIIVRNRTRTEDWSVFHRSMRGENGRSDGNTGGLRLNETDAVNLNATTLYRATPNYDYFEVGSDYRMNGNYPLVAYVFANSQGFSHFGDYKGNGQTNGNGPYVWCGFKPKWLMIKPNSGGVAHWFMHDSVRSPTNVMDDYLAANTNSVQGTSSTLNIDFVSNGFKIRGNNNTNFANTNYIFWAMAEAPFVSGTGVPTTAK
jgi:hypothetical protein